MSRVLAYTSPARGHLYPLTPILLELRDRGHDVSVLNNGLGGRDGVRGSAWTRRPSPRRSRGSSTRRLAVPRSPSRAWHAWCATFADRAPLRRVGPTAGRLDDVRPDSRPGRRQQLGRDRSRRAVGRCRGLSSAPTRCPWARPDAPPEGPVVCGRARGAGGPAARPTSWGRLYRGTMERTMLPPLNDLTGSDMGLARGSPGSTRSPRAACRCCSPSPREPFEYARSEAGRRLVDGGRRAPWGRRSQPRRVAGGDRGADRARDDLVGVPGRRARWSRSPSRPLAAELGARHRDGARRRRSQAGARDPRRTPMSCPSCRTPRSFRAGRVRRHARGDGSHPEGACPWCAGLALCHSAATSWRWPDGSRSPGPESACRPDGCAPIDFVLLSWRRWAAGRCGTRRGRVRRDRRGACSGGCARGPRGRLRVPVVRASVRAVVRADFGAGVVVVKALEHVLRDRDPPTGERGPELR